MIPTQPDTLHTRLREEIERRLAVARAATNHTGEWRWGHGMGDMCNDPTCPYGVLLDAALADERIEGTVLMEVHAVTGWPCAEIWSLAHRLGVSVDG